MNNDELESILKKARPPEIPAESLEAFPRRVAASLRSRRGEEAEGSFLRNPARNFFPRPAWAFALAAVCGLLVFALCRWHGRMATETVPPDDILASAKFSSETLALFPNRLRAIIEDARGLRFDLSESDNVPASPPLYVRVCDGRECSSFVTFSGQEIQVAGQNVTVLSDARGGIILAGDQFVWFSAEPAHAASHLKIAARVLAPSAM